MRECASLRLPHARQPYGSGVGRVRGRGCGMIELIRTSITSASVIAIVVMTGLARLARSVLPSESRDRLEWWRLVIAREPDRGTRDHSLREELEDKRR